MYWQPVFQTCTLLPLALVLVRPGTTVTRHVVAASQVMWSGLFIHLSGGRIETHFTFGSLAFFTWCMDPRVLATATVLVIADHLVRRVVLAPMGVRHGNPQWLATPSSMVHGSLSRTRFSSSGFSSGFVRCRRCSAAVAAATNQPADRKQSA